MEKTTTIISSVYNGDLYIKGFMENIVRQTKFDDCLLFLLNCNSKGREFDAIWPYLRKYPNIRYEQLPYDCTVYEAWNYVIANSSSKYLTNANIDDKLRPDFIEKTTALLDDNEDIDVAYCYNVVTNDYNITDADIDYSDKNLQIFNTGEFSIPNLLGANLPHNHPLWRRSLHDRYGLFSTNFVSGSDWEFWLRCAMGGSKMSLIKEPLGIYYHNPVGVSTNVSNMQRNISEVIKIHRYYSYLYEKSIKGEQSE